VMDAATQVGAKNANRYLYFNQGTPNRERVKGKGSCPRIEEWIPAPFFARAHICNCALI
jgi:hypothetical protein